MNDFYTKYLKKIMVFLLSILSIFIIIKIYPFIINIIKIVVKLIIPFISSFLIAYLLEPIVLLFNRVISRRTICVFITIIIFYLLIFLLFYFSIPLFINEINHFKDNYQTIIESIKISVNQFASNFKFLPKDYQPTFNNIENIIKRYLDAIDFKLIIFKFIDYLKIFVLVPMTTIYFMIDFPKIKNKIKNYLISKNYLRFNDLLIELNDNIKIFIKTSLIIMSIVFALSTISLFFAKSDYPLFFGLIIAITNIIPYLGPYIGGLFPVLFALSVSKTRALIMVIIVVIVQVLESNIITPYLQGKKSDVHPILVLVSLVVSNKLFGIVGMILAVPLLMVLKITYKYYPVNKLIFKNKHS